jgi:spermidine dehydrogenase
MSDPRDRDLGMDRAITRRDFLNGVGVALSGSIAYPWFGGSFDEFRAGRGVEQAGIFEPEKAADYYPPVRTGLRGTHDGAWEVAHALRDAGRDARILVLDNHDDFGGHAKRNEFTSGGRTIVGYGGTQAIEGRLTWTPVAKGLRDELGIDTDKFFKAFDATPYSSRGLGQGVFFDKETWTVDRLVKGGQGNPAEGPPPPDGWWRRFAADAPFSPAARRDFVRLHEERTDYLPALSVQQKRAQLRKISYSRSRSERIAACSRRPSRSSCTRCACPASPGRRAATSTAPAAASCSRRRSRPSSGGRAISSRECSSAAASIRRRTSRRSPSTAGRTATPTSAIH